MATSIALPGTAAEGTPFRVYTRVLDWLTTERSQLINISERIALVVRDSRITQGSVHIQSLHTTTAIMLSEWQDALRHDIGSCLEGLVERYGDWRHNNPQYSNCERKNADSHLRGMILGQQVSMHVRDGTLLLGTWQSIILAEFDGPQNRSVAVQVSGV